MVTLNNAEIQTRLNLFFLISSMISHHVKRFHKVHIEITNICNLQCSFCPPVIRENKSQDKGLFETQNSAESVASIG